ncbi:hypothetical protein [Kitasatospora terrestris]|uniref:hypothetical protein n=1 Tax=Kitasatospora terrestris TaxID=258051 RepID=UPI0031E77FA1
MGLLLCALVGVELGGIVAGIMSTDTATGVVLTVVGANLAPWTAMGGFVLLYRGRRRASQVKQAPPRLEPAMARIESSRAVGEGPDIPLDLDLTVAPAGVPAYRAGATAVVNLMDLDDFRVGRTVVVDHDPLRPWDVRVRIRPDGEWAGRLAAAGIDTAPPESRRAEPPRPAGSGGRTGTARIGMAAIAVGAVLSLVPFHGYY